MSKFLPVISAVALAAAAHAQGTPTPKLEYSSGVVTSISDSEIALKGADGKTQVIKLLPEWAVGVSKPISIEEIKPGSYLGTTNIAKPDGTGRSVEVHVSPPGQGGPGVDFEMDREAQTTMTNGTVTTVVNNPGGRVLEINHGKGVRKVTVPPGTPITLSTRGSRDLVKPGLKIRMVKFTPADGGPPRQFITVGENGAPVE